MMKRQDIEIDTPILIIGRSRPKHLSNLLNSEALKRCVNIYIYLDGPEIKLMEDEREKPLYDTQQIAKEFQKRRQAKIFISETQLGCYRGVTSGIDWFFSHEKEGIILEDDLVLHQSAIVAAGRALEKYRNEKAISSICLYRVGNSDETYRFTVSSFTSSWGWATWKSRWSDFDHNVERRLMFHPAAMMKHGGFQGMRRWIEVIKRLRKRELDSWGYRWLFSVWLKGGVNLVSPFNLIENQGFGISATHTKNGQSNSIDEKFEVNRIDWSIPAKNASSQYDKLLMRNQFGLKNMKYKRSPK